MQNHTSHTAGLLRRALTFFAIAFGLLASAHAAPAFPEFVDPNPSADNGFGSHVVALSTGNVVITSPRADIGGTDTGAVYLFNGATGALISTLVGSTESDQVGRSGVTALTNGNYVVSSPSWDNGAVLDAGAVTWGNGTTGISGAVSPANSLVGSTAGDNVGGDFVGNTGVTALTNGNYVVSSPSWDNGAVLDAGAVTWGNGTTGISGAVSPANSLVGSTANDFVGSDGVTALSNGNYVVRSQNWTNGTVSAAGAVTWGNGTTGSSGVVSAANSLVGSTANESVGFPSVTALTNGNYVVSSQYWDNGAVLNVGAVTWGNGTTGISGVVSAANSLVGSTASDLVGFPSVIALTNGNYVVRSEGWDNGAVLDVGAVTWGSGTTGIIGVVSTANSLVGSTAGDNVGGGSFRSGDGSVTALTNGNYVVSSILWDNGAVRDAGAVTWGNGTTGSSGVVSPANSLVGSTAGDFVGITGVTALTNGNYVVRSEGWDNGAVRDVGAVTWGNGTTGISGVVSTANSLVGSTANDNVGGGSFSRSNGNVTALTNGNYVVSSAAWDNGAVRDVGAVTWGNGTTGIIGVVSTANSLVGSTASDFVGVTGVTALTNGNYVVRSQSWDNGAVLNVGAVTWGNGTTGISGVVSTANSLVGSTANDLVGLSGVTALTNGNYVVSSQFWNNGAATEAGAVTWGNGTTGSSGVVSAANSLVGLVARSSLQVTVLDNVNNHFIAPFVAEGKVRVGSQIDGLAPNNAPTVTTATSADITATAATLGGNVTADGGAAVTDRGIVWNTTGTPTTADTKVANGTGTGVFSATVGSLPSNTTIYVRAYATNRVNTSYGAAISFATIEPVTTGNVYTGLLTDETGRVRGSFLGWLGTTGFGTITVWVDGKRGSIKVLGKTTLSVLVGGAPVTVNFPAGPVAPSGNPTRSVTLTIGTETLTGSAIRSPYGLRRPSFNHRRYTFTATSETVTPSVAAVMSGTITPYGAVRITARLGNGRVVTFSSREQGNGKIAVYCGYGIGGAQSLAGTLAFTSPTPPELTGTLRWTVPAGVDARMPAGVDANYEGIGARYKANTVGNLLVLDATKKIRLGIQSPGIFSGALKNYTFPMTTDVIPFASTSPFSQIKFFPATGRFSGTTSFAFVQRNFHGVLMQGTALNYGVGYFQDTSALGAVSILPLDSLR